MPGIILKYRCPRRPGAVGGERPLGPLLDSQRAVSLVRSRATEWGIDPKRIGMVGFSAGGHLALATATNFEKRTYEPIDAVEETSCPPGFPVLCYSGYLKAKHNAAAELQVYATGDHDFGVRQNEKLPSSWTHLCLKWLRSQDLLKVGADE